MSQAITDKQSAKSPPELNYLLTESLDQLKDYFENHGFEPSLIDPQEPTITGFCYVCGQEVRFMVEGEYPNINWRETIRCPQCLLMNRWRSSIHIFEILCSPQADHQIYITEAVTPLFGVLEQRFQVTGSEYKAELASGEHFYIGETLVLIQDVTDLSFEDSSFDYVLSFDVLEHVPDYSAALGEMYRVLRPGGQIVLSAPFNFSEQTVIRATMDADGEIHHILPPEYHGDPVSDQGVLCFQVFGVDLLAELRKAGFHKAKICVFTSRELGYYEPHVIFMATKKLGRMSRLKQLITQGRKAS